MDRLRQSEADIISLVAVKDEQIVGHILFSPMTIKGDVSVCGMAARSLAVQNDNKQTASSKPIAKYRPEFDLAM